MRDISLRAVAAISLALLFAALAVFLPLRNAPRLAGDAGGGAASAGAARLSPWGRAVLRIEEDRGEEVGRRADVEVPAQVRHYSGDTRRFLATQIAEAFEQRIDPPGDYAELARLIRSGELVELQPLETDFLLYGVGYNADDGPFTHYDEKSGTSVPLFADDAALRREIEQLDGEAKASEEKIADLEKQIKGLDKGDNARRKELRAQVVREQKLIPATKKQKEILEKFYGDARTRRHLAADYETIAALAADFGGRSYDLDDASARKDMKARMLSFLRPPARRVLEQLARSYREKFGRHLPVTSLVRTEEYQRRLSRVNPNATRVGPPPHSTGLAFDILYRHMTADEQAHVMSELARLRDEGRLEVLRERRDHFHVFAFADGERPGEALIKHARVAAAGGQAEEVEEVKPAPKRAERSAKKGAEERRGKKETEKKKATATKRRGGEDRRRSKQSRRSR